jgi:hypothetical protein
MATHTPRFSVKCSFIRFIPIMQCWNMLIQIYSSKQTEPKHTKPIFPWVFPFTIISAHQPRHIFQHCMNGINRIKKHFTEKRGIYVAMYN